MDGKTYTIKVYVTGNQGVYNQSQGQQGSAIQKTDGDGYVQFEYKHTFDESDYKIYNGLLLFMADVDYAHTAQISVSTMTKSAFDGIMDLMQEIGENETTSEQADLQQQYMQTMYSGYRVVSFDVVDSNGNSTTYTVPTTGYDPAVSIELEDGVTYTFRTKNALATSSAQMIGGGSPTYPTVSSTNGYNTFTYTHDVSNNNVQLSYLKLNIIAKFTHTI